MSADVQQVKDWINTRFDAVEKWRGTRFPIIRAFIEHVRALAIEEAPAIAAQLPPNFQSLDWRQIVDVVFGVLAATFPQYAFIIEAVQAVVDSFLSSAPPLP